MTHIEAMKQMVEALEEASNGLLWFQDAYPEHTNGSDDEAMARIDAAIKRGEKAIAEAEKQEPVAVVTGDAWNASIRFLPEGLDLPIDTLLYTHPQPKAEQDGIELPDGVSIVRVKAGKIVEWAEREPKREPLTDEQRQEVIRVASKAMDQDINLSWRMALISATEAAHCITEKGGAAYD